MTFATNQRPATAARAKSRREQVLRRALYNCGRRCATTPARECHDYPQYRRLPIRRPQRPGATARCIQVARRRAGAQRHHPYRRGGHQPVSCGCRPRVEAFLETLLADARFAPIEVRRSWSAQQPFKRLLVKIKREIVCMRRPEINPRVASAPRLAPQELKRWLDQGRTIVLLDTRNQFEVDWLVRKHACARIEVLQRLSARDTGAAGGVEGPAHRDVLHRRHTLRKSRALADQPGFSRGLPVGRRHSQLLRAMRGAYFRGECFVFDQRVALDARLRETDQPRLLA